MSTPATPVVVVGSINLDQVLTVDRLPQPGETIIGTSMALLPGGKGANQAVAAARRGAGVTMVGAVGNDSNAAVATSLLAESGVDTSHVAEVPGPTGTAIVSVDADGENTIIVIPGANAAVDDAFVEQHRDVISGAAVVVLQGEIPASGIQAAVGFTAGRVILNLAPVIAVDPAILRRADPLVVNEHEGAVLLRSLIPGEDDVGDDAAVVSSLRNWGVPSVVLTRGANGAICSDSVETVSVPSPKVAAVDTSGAGDGFVGALSASLADGSSLKEAVEQAVRVGAFAVGRRGTQAAYPTLDDALPGGRA